jgi:hypothetical protein
MTAYGGLASHRFVRGRKMLCTIITMGRMPESYIERSEQQSMENKMFKVLEFFNFFFPRSLQVLTLLETCRKQSLVIRDGSPFLRKQEEIKVNFPLTGNNLLT